MKIMQINCVYKVGSTGKIVNDLHRELKKNGYDSAVCYGRGDIYKEPGVYKTSYESIAKLINLKSKITGREYNGSFLATKKLIHIIKLEKPDIVHLHCINGFFVNIYSLLNFLKSNNIKTVLTLHAEFMYTGGCGHALDCVQWINGCKKCSQLKDQIHSFFLDRTKKNWFDMKKSFDDFDNLYIVSVSSWLYNRAIRSSIMNGKKHTIVLNGIDTENQYYYRPNKNLINKYKLDNKKVILHVTSSFLSDIKGGEYVIQLAKQLKDKVFIIIGNTDKINDLPDNIIDIGRIENQQTLAEFYSVADITLLTSKRETFSMICAESLSCGTRVVGFKSGAPEKISLAEYSDFCEYGDIKELKDLVEKNLEMKYDKKLISKVSKKIYSTKRMFKDYEKIYKDLYEL